MIEFLMPRIVLGFMSQILQYHILQSMVSNKNIFMVFVGHTLPVIYVKTNSEGIMDRFCNIIPFVKRLRYGS